MAKAQLNRNLGEEMKPVFKGHVLSLYLPLYAHVYIHICIRTCICMCVFTYPCILFSIFIYVCSVVSSIPTMQARQTWLRVMWSRRKAPASSAYTSVRESFAATNSKLQSSYKPFKPREGEIRQPNKAC